jgi:hypothetical protein
MATHAIRRNAIFLTPMIAALLERVKNFVVAMVIAQGNAIEAERAQTLRRLGLTEKEFPVSFG